MRRAVFVGCLLMLSFLAILFVWQKKGSINLKNPANTSPCAADSMLDPTFGNCGKVITDFEDKASALLWYLRLFLKIYFEQDVRNDVLKAGFGKAIAIQSDGKIVVAGQRSSIAGLTFGLARYNPDGTLDASFGEKGKVITDFGGSDDQGNAVAVQKDGKIVVSGGSGGDFALARYNPDGSLDTSFGKAGKVTTDFGKRGVGLAIAIQKDGKIVVVGYIGAARNYDFALARYNANGSLDTSFGMEGKVITDFGGNDGARAIAIQSDGKIVVAGGSDGNFALARYNPNGTLDSSFGTGGKVTTDFGGSLDYGKAIAIQSDGKIVVAGQVLNGSNTDFALARYNTDGTLDASFGEKGKVITDFGGSDDQGNAVAIQKDGKIVVAGTYKVGSNSDFAIARYNTDGTLDASFGKGGKETTDFGGDDKGWAIAIQADGKIIVAGYSSGSHFVVAGYSFGSYLDFTLARYRAQ